MPRDRHYIKSHTRRTLWAVALLALALIGACRPTGPDGATATEPAAATTVPGPAASAGTTQPAPAPVGGTEVPATSSELGTGRGPAVDLPTDRPLRAAFLVVDGVYNSELMAPFDVLQHTVFHAKPGIEPFTVSPDGQPVTTFEGIRILPRYSFASAPAIDILVVPSAKGSMDTDLQNAALIDWVRRTGGAARYVMSLCDGAFVLAKAGLLDGVPATTFPDDYDRLAKAFPKVELRINVSYVHAGKFLTSEGGARSYDVAMHLVDQLYGEKAAQEIGHGLLLPWPPGPGEQPRIVEPGPTTRASEAGSEGMR